MLVPFTGDRVYLIDNKPLFASNIGADNYIDLVWLPGGFVNVGASGLVPIPIMMNQRYRPRLAFWIAGLDRADAFPL